MFKALLILLLLGFMPLANASEEEARKLLSLTGVGETGEAANPVGSLVVSRNAELAKKILEKVNGAADDGATTTSDVLIMATGKTAEALLLLAKEIGVTAIRTVGDVVIIVGQSAEAILDELVKTGLVAVELISDTAKNIVLLGKNVLIHALKVIGNLMATGMIYTADLLLKAAEGVFYLLKDLFHAAGYLLTAAVSGAILVVNYGIKGITKLVQLAGKAIVFAVKFAFDMVVGVIKIVADGIRYMLQKTKEAINAVLEKIIAKEKEIGDRMVQKSADAKKSALEKLKSDWKNFGKGKKPGDGGDNPAPTPPAPPTPANSELVLSFNQI